MQHDAGSDEQLSGIGRRDHTETAEYRVFGPPGTGKTTHLSRQICHAAKRFGPNSVLVTSFSKAAAAELTGRELPISSDRVTREWPWHSGHVRESSFAMRNSSFCALQPYGIKDCLKQTGSDSSHVTW